MKNEQNSLENEIFQDDPKILSREWKGDKDILKKNLLKNWTYFGVIYETIRNHWIKSLVD